VSVTVVVNMMTVSHAGSNGTSIAFPDVCKTPSPGGPIPIPYPNVAMSSDLADGTSKVKFDGKSVAHKKANIKMSSGDEAGSAQGVVSNKIKGKATFVNYSFDVKVEGQNVCRLADPTQQNKGSANAFGPAHIQAPAMVMESQLENCEKTQQKQKEQQSEESQWGASGIISEHRPKLQKIADELQVILYFRATNPACGPWIRMKHKPKPHEVIEAKTISAANQDDVQKWLDKYFAVMDEVKDTAEGKWSGVVAAELHKAKQGIKPLPDYFSRKAVAYSGIVMNMQESRRGMPMQGYGKDSRKRSYGGKWITGDYDLMDVMGTGDKCERPCQNGEDFARIKNAINKSLNWDAIQHGPQSQWVAKSEASGGHDHADFSIPAQLKAYLKSDATKPPTVPIAEGRNLPICDSKLTVVAPKGAVIYLENDEDVKTALLCMGCDRD
jgi:hypothetical protein